VSPATLTVDLGRVVRVSSVVAEWATKPASTRVLTSADGTSWTEAKVGATGKLQGPADARYVRLEVTRSGTTNPGLRELVVR
jgi:hypothetical protein